MTYLKNQLTQNQIQQVTTVDGMIFTREDGQVLRLTEDPVGIAVDTYGGSLCRRGIVQRIFIPWQHVTSVKLIPGGDRDFIQTQEVK